jgi:Excalibur calcium-binding domain
MKTTLIAAVVVAAAVMLAGPANAGTDRATGGASVELIPRLYKSCTNYNRRYPHGVGRRLARDKVRPGATPVTTFVRSTVLYLRAMRYNRGLDRDKDGIACEKK